jgi:transposase
MAMEVSTGSMMSSCESKELNHLGLVTGMYDELGVGKSIDALIPQDMKQRNISIGQILKAMVLNGLGFANQRLYLLPHFFDGKPIEHLLGEGVSASDLNDDVTGRMLDSIYDAGASDVYRVIAKNALQSLGLSCHMSHIDTTTFHTDGQYDHADEEGVIKITKGYSRDHRPELNQFGLKLIVEGQAGIPMMMQSLSGNDNDKTRFKETIRDHIGQLQDDFSIQHIVGDSALYCAETLQLMQGLIWITRVPETLSQARHLIETLADDLARENDGEQPNFKSVDVTYADIEQQWIVVYSPQANARANHSVSRQYEKQSLADQRLFDALCKQEFACEEDALKAVEPLKKKLKVSMLDDVMVETLLGFKKRGRPFKDAKPDHFTYRICASLASDYQQYQQRLKRKSCFILATNQTDRQRMDGDQMLADYKNQQKVERGFRFLKDPMFLASSVFLKSPKRIMALTMVMTVCLLVYAALEHRIRKSLIDNDSTFPNQTGKMINNPTIRWVFQYFQNIPVIYLQQTKAAVLNVSDQHAKLLQLMGNRYLKFYS